MSEFAKGKGGGSDVTPIRAENDPLALFQRMPSVSVDPSEIDAMKQAVATLRRTSRIETESRERNRALPEILDGPVRFGKAAALRWGRAAAIIALFAGTLLLIPGHSGDQGIPALLSPVVAEAEAPSMDELDLTDARVYHLAQDELSGFWIVHESLDL